MVDSPGRHELSSGAINGDDAASSTTVFCAVSQYLGTSSTISCASCASSDGGSTWTNGTTPYNYYLAGLVYGNSTFVCVYATDPSFNATANYSTSTDGINWTARTFPGSLCWEGICWTGTQFVVIVNTVTSAFTSTGSNLIYTSPDGITWTSHATLSSTSLWAGVTTSGTLLFAWGSSTEGATSGDGGATWTAQTLPVAFSNAAGNGTTIVALNSSTTTAYYTSPDLVTWTSRTLPISGPYTSITWNGTYFVIVASFTSGSFTGAYSSDGVTWTATGGMGTQQEWQSVG